MSTTLILPIPLICYNHNKELITDEYELDLAHHDARLGIEWYFNHSAPECPVELKESKNAIETDFGLLLIVTAKKSKLERKEIDAFCTWVMECLRDQYGTEPQPTDGFFITYYHAKNSYQAVAIH